MEVQIRLSGNTATYTTGVLLWVVKTLQLVPMPPPQPQYQPLIYAQMAGGCRQAEVEVNSPP